MGEDTQFKLGSHEQAIESLQIEMSAVRASLSRIETTLAEAKGGYRMLVTVGAIGGAVGAGLTGLVKILASLKLGA